MFPFMSVVYNGDVAMEATFASAAMLNTQIEFARKLGCAFIVHFDRDTKLVVDPQYRLPNLDGVEGKYLKALEFRKAKNYSARKAAILAEQLIAFALAA